MMMIDPAAIPYIPAPSLDLGITKLQSWGLLVAAGFLFGAWFAARWAKRTGLSAKPVYDFAMWAFLGGFVGAHLVHVLAYEPEIIKKNPLALLYFWEGVSSFGGFLGAGIAAFIYFRISGLPFLPYSDALALGMAPGWAIGRIGCFLAHDHIGRSTQCWLGIDFPAHVVSPPGIRHDLGLYDSLVSWTLFAVLLLVVSQKPRYGVLGAILCSTYAIARFFLDYLRAVDIQNPDARYFGLTPAQYGCFLLLFAGIGLFMKSRGVGGERSFSTWTHQQPPKH